MVQNWNPGSPLPNAQQAAIDPRKFYEYSLNPDNPQNKGKWIAFAIIGYNVGSDRDRQAATQEIVSQLCNSLPGLPAIENEASVYGRRFEVRIEIEGPNGRSGTLITKWQIDSGTEVPRLITNWLKL